MGGRAKGKNLNGFNNVNSKIKAITSDVSYVAMFILISREAECLQASQEVKFVRF